MIQRARRFRRSWGLALVLLVAGCATGRAVEGDPFGSARGRNEVVLLTVENHDFRDASIYAVWNGMKTRVGSVTGKTSQTFRVQWRSEELRLDVDFLGSGRYSTESVDVTQGDHLNFVIMPGA